MPVLTRALHARFGARVGRTRLELGHLAFHAFFDTERYHPASPTCPYAVGPVPALVLDGRVVAVTGIGYVREHNCPGNRHYVNLLAFGLIQPSTMGGRYRARRSAASE